jgi:arylsulfatase A-like enzyme
MTGTTWTLSAIVIAAAAAVGLSASAGEKTAEAARSKPNVVLIMTDDQTVHDLSVMPRTRKALGARGTTFSRSYVSYPLCCPSRATSLTGRYSHNHGVQFNSPPLGGYGKLDKPNTLGVWLQRRGYVTSHIGKFLNGYGQDAPADVPPGWTEWSGSVDPSSYRMWGYTLNENGSLRTYGQPDVEDPALYQADVYRSKAVDFIRRRSGPVKPFYLSVAFLAPHGEITPARGHVSVRSAPRHRGKFATKPLPRPPSFNEADMTDKPRWMRGRPRLGTGQVRGITRDYRARQESLQAVDEAVDAIVRSLRDTGELKNTYLIFTSDNGHLHGEHRVPSGKILVYEPSSRVPLIIRGPGIRGGRTSRELVANVDLAATVLDVTGAKASLPVDGRSLVPYAKKPARRTRRPILHEAGPFGYRAVRTSRYLWLESGHGGRELYDRKVDPHELRSRHADPRYKRIRARLHRELRRLARCKGRGCRRQLRPLPAPSKR